MHPPTSWAKDWGAISRKKCCMIRSWCQRMTYRKPPKFHALSTGEVTFDTAWLKSQRLLADRPSLPKLSPCYCALHFHIVLCHEGHHEKVGGTAKIVFSREAPEFVPPLLKCFRRHWSQVIVQNLDTTLLSHPLGEANWDINVSDVHKS